MKKIRNLYPKGTVLVRVHEEHGGVMITIGSSEVMAEGREQDSRLPPQCSAVGCPGDGR